MSVRQGHEARGLQAVWYGQSLKYGDWGMELERLAGPAHEGSDRIRHACWKGHFRGSRENKLEVKDCCSKRGEMNLPTMEVTLRTEDLEI